MEPMRAMGIGVAVLAVAAMACSAVDDSKLSGSSGSGASSSNGGAGGGVSLGGRNAISSIVGHGRAVISTPYRAPSSRANESRFAWLGSSAARPQPQKLRS